MVAGKGLGKDGVKILWVTLTSLNKPDGLARPDDTEVCPTSPRHDPRPEIEEDHGGGYSET
jgi:hypothetical protein